MALPSAVCTIVSSNLGAAVCDICTHEWTCPNPTVHQLAGYCPDCEVWAEIREEHIQECAARCIARWRTIARAALDKADCGCKGY